MTTEAEATDLQEERLLRLLAEETRDLIRRLEGSSVQRLAIQAGQYRIEIERGTLEVVHQTAAPAAAHGAAGGDGAAAAVPDTRHPIVAPLVGTFYRSQQPGAKPFVEVGDVVDVGQTVAIVEAMKIMNQIAADRSGRVAEILVNDGDWVEFQQVLIYLEPNEP
jgi:acetyl-CoA carboxylase biotin carboxyl carrier protein